MKTTKSIQMLLLLAILIASCNKKDDYSLPTVEVNGVEIADLDPDLLMPIDVKLSQIAENLGVVELEADTGCVLSGEARFQVGDKYIIARDLDGIYQFSIDGSFIRKLVNYGRAPGEMLMLPQYYLSEDDDILYVFGRDKINFYRLSTGSFIGTKGKPILGTNESFRICRYIGDSLILFSYGKYGSQDPSLLGCGVKIQTVGGEVLWQKEFDYNSWSILPAAGLQVLAGSEIIFLSTNDPDEYILQVQDQDTVYKLNTKTYSLFPFLLKRAEKQTIDGFPVERSVVNCSVEDEEFANVNGYQMLNLRYVEDSRNFLGYRSLILYDDNKKTAFRIGTFQNDYFGFSHGTEGDMTHFHNFPMLLNPYGKLVEKYDAFTFLQFAEEALKNPDLNATVRERLQDITDKLTDVSNPVLLIGDMKDRIDI